MMSKFKHVMTLVKVVIVIVVCVVGYKFYQNYEESQLKQKNLKLIEKLNKDGKYKEALDKYREFTKKYPGEKPGLAARISVFLQNNANDKSIKAMGIPTADTARKQKAFREVINLLENAEEYGELNEESVLGLCDAYIECKEYGKAEKLIKDSKGRTGISSSKLSMYENRIKRVLKKK